MKAFAKEISKKYNIDLATTEAAVEAVALELSLSADKLTEFIVKSKPIHRAHLAAEQKKLDDAAKKAEAKELAERNAANKKAEHEAKAAAKTTVEKT